MSFYLWAGTSRRQNLILNRSRVSIRRLKLLMVYHLHVHRKMHGGILFDDALFSGVLQLPFQIFNFDVQFSFAAEMTL